MATFDTGSKQLVTAAVTDKDGEEETWALECFCEFGEDHDGHPLDPVEDHSIKTPVRTS
jgi:hypothetical protein